MKISFKSQSIERKNNDVCIVIEYPNLDAELDFAIVEIKGQYPNEKFGMNTKCKEMVYVQKGSGEVIVNDKTFMLNEGDLILIEAGEKFIWKGNMTLCISCHPAFSLEQHVIVD